MTALPGVPQPANIQNRCGGCRAVIEDGEPVVQTVRKRYVCQKCADALWTHKCYKCARRITGEYMYLHIIQTRSGGRHRHSVCSRCHDALTEAVP